MALEAAAGYLLLRPVDTRETRKTPGGIELPDSANEQICEAEVLSAGGDIPFEGHLLCAPAVSGERVIFQGHRQIVIREQGKTLHLLRFQDVLAVRYED